MVAETVVGVLVVGRCTDGKEGRHAKLGHEVADACGHQLGTASTIITIGGSSSVAIVNSADGDW